MNYFPLFKENNCELNDANKDAEKAAMIWRKLLWFGEKLDGEGER